MDRSFKNFSFLIALPLTGVVASQAFVLGQQSGTLVEPAQRTRAALPPVQDKETTPQTRQDGLRHSNSLNSERSAVISMDHMIVHCMNIAAQEEIAFSKFGHEKSKNPAVRAFAEQMVKEHSEAAKSLPKHYVAATRNWSTAGLNELEIAANESQAERPSDRPTLADRIAGVVDAIDGEQRTVLKPALPEQEGVQPDSPIVSEDPRPEADAQVASDQVNSNVLAIQSEIAQQCLADTKAKLAKEQGDTFDQSFVGFQIAMHQSLQSKLKVFERHASPEVKPLVEKSLKTTEKHLKQAEALMAKLAHDHSEEAGR